MENDINYSVWFRESLGPLKNPKYLDEMKADKIHFNALYDEDKNSPSQNNSSNLRLDFKF